MKGFSDGTCPPRESGSGTPDIDTIVSWHCGGFFHEAGRGGWKMFGWETEEDFIKYKYFRDRNKWLWESHYMPPLLIHFWRYE